MKRVICLIFALATLGVASAQIAIEKPYAVGADISWLQWQEDSGVKFSDGGVEGDALDILRDNGFNYIRLRIFVNPKSELGYSQRDGYCDLEHTLAMAKRIKDVDKARAKYYSSYTGRVWGDKLNYDLCVNTTNHSIKDIAASIAHLIGD